MVGIIRVIRVVRIKVIRIVRIKVIQILALFYPPRFCTDTLSHSLFRFRILSSLLF